MSCSNGIYCKPCNRCKRSYSVRYFDRHDCNSNSKMQKVDVDDANGEFDNNTKECGISHLDEPAEDQETVDDTPLLNSNFSNDETEGFVNDNTDEGSKDEILDGYVFEELLQEAVFVQENISPENSNSCVSTLVYWLWLFIALGQKKFNITERAMEFLVKVLALLMKVYSRED